MMLASTTMTEVRSRTYLRHYVLYGQNPDRYRGRAEHQDILIVYFQARTGIIRRSQPLGQLKKRIEFYKILYFISHADKEKHYSAGDVQKNTQEGVADRNCPRVVRERGVTPVGGRCGALAAPLAGSRFR
jgi:hypothetical protein